MNSIRSTVGIVSLLLIATSCSMLVTADQNTQQPINSQTVVPDDGPSYGVNKTTFQRLWSRDVDTATLTSTEFTGTVSSRTEFITRLSKATDIPFSHPPPAVTNWNTGEFTDANLGSIYSSIYPAGANPIDATYLTDVYVSIFAIQPSTVVHTGNGTPLYVSPDGAVLAITDYRIALPADDRNGTTHETWALVETQTQNFTLRVNGTIIDIGDGHRATLQYHGLTGSPQLTVTVAVTVTVKHSRRSYSCTNTTQSSNRTATNATTPTNTTTAAGPTNTTDKTTGDSTPLRCQWNTSATYLTETVTVHASQQVIVTEFTNISATRVRFEANPDRVGAVIHPNTIWAQITIEDGISIRSSWWFYTAGKPGWQTMAVSTATGTKYTDSMMRPLQIHAFPSREAPYVEDKTDAIGSRRLTIHRVWGPIRDGPTLPSNININPANTYVSGESIALSSTDLPETAFQKITLYGIVRGQKRTITLDESRTVTETTLTIHVAESTSSYTRLKAIVTETATGEPITAGVVIIEGRTAQLNEDGEAVVTIADPPLIVRGEYSPAPWWRTKNAYAAADDAVKISPDLPGMKDLINLALVTLIWFLPAGLAVYGFDYLTGGEFIGITNRQ